MIKKIIYGNTPGICGKQLYFDLGDKDGMLTWKFPDSTSKDDGWDLYCKHFKITLEEITLEEHKKATGR